MCHVLSARNTLVNKTNQVFFIFFPNASLKSNSNAFRGKAASEESISAGITEKHMPT